jgi:hypothetical protein
MAYDYKNDPNNPDAKPLYNSNILAFWNWFDTVWNCNDWIVWHQSMVKKYGTASANTKWLKDWNNLATGSSAIDCRSFNTAFRTYAKKVGLYDSLYSGLGVIAEPIGAGTDIIGGVSNAASGLGGAVGTTGKILKIAIPLLVIIAIVFVVIYANKKLKTT